MSEISKAIQFLCEEKNLSYDAVLEAIEFALAAAYRKDFGNKQQNIKVKFNPDTGAMQVWDIKTVVEDIEEDVLTAAQDEMIRRREKAKDEDRELTDEETADLVRFNPKLEMMISEAKKIKKGASLGEVLEIELEANGDFGRMAAQTAKQVIIQKVREAERNMVFDDFKGQEGSLVIGTLQRVEGRKILVDLGKVTGLLPSDQQVSRDFYRPGSKMKFYISSVQMGSRGPEIILSRTDVGLVREIFKQEIPEMKDGMIEIKGIAREAGFRSKVAVQANEESIDPIGSCIGQRGGRINTIIEELGGEKIDIIRFSENASEYISNALSPAKISEVELNNETKSATVYVASDQFSLAIGRAGQNVRLAAQLSGWSISVKEKDGTQEVSSDEPAPEEEVKTEEPTEAVENQQEIK